MTSTRLELVLTAVDRASERVERVERGAKRVQRAAEAANRAQAASCRAADAAGESTVAAQRRARAAIDQTTAALERQRRAHERIRTQRDRWLGRSAVMTAGGLGAMYGGQMATRRAISPAMAYASFDAAADAVAAIARVKVDGAADRAMRERARELGASTPFTAIEAMQGQEFLARAGMTPEMIVGSIGSTLSLAQAGRLDLATAADIQSDIGTAMGMIGPDMEVADVERQMTRLADVLSGVAMRANTDVRMLGEAAKYAAPLARNFGMDIETMSSAIGVMADSGVKGSMAGTAMRGTLQRLADPPKEAAEALEQLGVETMEMVDGERRLRPFVDIMQDINEATADMGSGDRAALLGQISGVYASAGFQAMLANLPKLIEMTEQLQSAQGEAARTSERMLDNLGGDWTKLTSASAAVWQDIGETIEPTLRRIVQHLTTAVREVHNFVGENPELVKALGLAAAGFAALVTAGGGVAATLGAVMLPLVMARYGMQMLGLRVARSATAMQAGAAAAQGMTQAIVPMAPATRRAERGARRAERRVAALGDAARRSRSGLSAAIPFLVRFGIQGAAVAGLGLLVYENWDKIKPVLADIVDRLDEAIPGVRKLSEDIGGFFEEIASGGDGKLDTAFDGIETAAENVAAEVKTMVGEMKLTIEELGIAGGLAVASMLKSMRDGYREYRRWAQREGIRRGQRMRDENIARGDRRLAAADRRRRHRVGVEGTPEMVERDARRRAEAERQAALAEAERMRQREERRRRDAARRAERERRRVEREQRQADRREARREARRAAAIEESRQLAAEQRAAAEAEVERLRTANAWRRVQEYRQPRDERGRFRRPTTPEEIARAEQHRRDQELLRERGIGRPHSDAGPPAASDGAPETSGRRPPRGGAGRGAILGAAIAGILSGVLARPRSADAAEGEAPAVRAVPIAPSAVYEPSDRATLPADAPSRARELIGAASDIVDSVAEAASDISGDSDKMRELEKILKLAAPAAAIGESIGRALEAEGDLPVPTENELTRLNRALELTREIERARAAGGRAGNREAREAARERLAVLQDLPEAARAGIGEYQRALREAGGEVTAEAERIAMEVRAALEIAVGPRADTTGLDRLITRAERARDAIREIPGVTMTGGDLPGRASGGPVRRGMPYVVGEEGEELFIPGENGHVVDAQTTRRLLAKRTTGISAGGGGVTINAPLTIHGGVRFGSERDKAEFREMLRQHSREVAEAVDAESRRRRRVTN